MSFISLTIHISAASGRTGRSKVTVGVAPTFRCTERAEKRKEVYSVCLTAFPVDNVN